MNANNEKNFTINIILGLFILIIFSLLIYIHYDSKYIKVQNLGIFGENRLESVLGQDGVNSIDFGEYTIWTFADTLIGDKPIHPITTSSTFDGKFKYMLSNSIAFTKKSESKDVNKAIFHFYQKDGRVTEFIKYREGENKFIRRLWANDGIKLGNTVYVYYMQIKLTGDSDIFVVDSIGLASWNVKNPNWTIGDPIEFERHDNLFKFNINNVTFGDCVVFYKNYVYVIGHYVKNKNCKIQIARVNPFEITNSNAYRFLTEDGRWIDDISKAGSFFDLVSGEVSMSIDNDTFVFFYCSLDGNIYQVNTNKLEELNTAEKKIIYQPGHIESDKPLMIYYSAKEIYKDNDYFYVVYMNPQNYQPILLKVKKRQTFNLKF